MLINFIVLSSCPAGTILSGLAVLKNQADPVALPDEEYPSWLWTILSDEKVSDLANEPRQPMKEGRDFDFRREKQRLRAVSVCIGFEQLPVRTDYPLIGIRLVSRRGIF